MTYIKIAGNDKSITCITGSIIFILFDNPDWQGGVLKLMKNDHFLVFLAVLVLFPEFLGRLRCGLC